MTPQELRIGNYVFIKEFGDKHQSVYHIEKSGINLWSDMGSKTLFAPEPIPLTKEWLSMFGFRRDNPIEWMVDDMCIEWFSDGWCYTGGEGVAFSIPIDSVHHLQNLYFALTGKELKLK